MTSQMADLAPASLETAALCRRLAYPQQRILLPQQMAN
jgi:hypothetical protein